MVEDLLNQFLASGAGAGAVVWAVLKIKFAAIEDKIRTAHKEGTRANARLDTHLEKQHQ